MKTNFYRRLWLKRIIVEGNLNIFQPSRPTLIDCTLSEKRTSYYFLPMIYENLSLYWKTQNNVPQSKASEQDPY